MRGRIIRYFPAPRPGAGIYNFVPSCTGAAARVVGGKIAPGANYASLHQRFAVR
jgi:hypothetical protein